MKGDDVSGGGPGVFGVDDIEVGGEGVGLDLFGGFAAGDDALDGGGFEAPGEGPLGHGDAGGDFGLVDFFDLGEAFVGVFGLPAVADVVFGELGAGLVLAGEESGGERDARQDAELEALADGEGGVFGGAAEAVVDELDSFAVIGGGFFNLGGAGGGAPPAADGVADVADFSGGPGFFQRATDLVGFKLRVAPGMTVGSSGGRSRNGWA